MRYGIFFILVIWGLSACRSDTGGEATGSAISLPEELPESFAEFYQRFLTDSLYQMEHILFPLQGLPDKADSLTLAANNFRWQMEGWNMHRPISGNDFTINFRMLTENTIQENIRHTSGNYAMERRYSNFDDGWYLIYYAGLNAVDQ